MKNLIWLIPLFPLAGFLVNGLLYLVTHRTRGEDPHASGAGSDAGHGGHGEAHGEIPFKAIHTVVGTGSVALSCLFAFGAIFDIGIAGLASGATHVVTLYRWLPLGVNEAVGKVPGKAAEWAVDAAFRLDSLSALMIAFVTFVGFLIHVYSVGYMAHDGGYGRFFAYLNLFMFAMLVLVLGGNFLLMFVGWEGVGLCSYLLIGYYYDKDFAADAGKKAFVVNRIGDLGFVLGIFGIFALFGTLDFGKVFAAAAADPASVEVYATLICLCLFIGAIGKSAQMPLYVWLPDAMAGPTPVSALIHAATMVTAGVYMVARCNVLFRLAPEAMLVVAVIGGFTAHPGRDDRPRAERHQEGAGVFDGFAARVHVPGLRRRGVRGGHVPRHDARLFQGLPLPRLGLGDPCPGRRAGHAQDGRTLAQDPDDV